MAKCRFGHKKGLALIDAMAATVIISIIVVGTAGFSYFATTDSRTAAMKISAARVGLLLVETWRGLDGSEFYDPVSSLGSAITIENSVGPAKPEDFTTLGSYKLVLDGVNYYATLSWKDVSADLRALNIAVVRSDSTLEDADFDSMENYFDMTTYADN